MMNELTPIDWLGRKKSGGKPVRVTVVTYLDALVAVAGKCRCGIDEIEVRIVRDGEKRAEVSAA